MSLKGMTKNRQSKKCLPKTKVKIILTRTTILQHEMRHTIRRKITYRKQALPIITSPGPSLPFGQPTTIP